jgi:hypothetical protein
MGACGWGIGWFSQKNVPHFSGFGGVDFFTGEHGVAMKADASLAGQLKQQGLGGGVNEVFRQVRKDTRRGLAESLKAFGVCGKRSA